MKGEMEERNAHIRQLEDKLATYMKHFHCEHQVRGLFTLVMYFKMLDSEF
jgi:hypothetical protein